MDLVISFDDTGSMSSVRNEVRRNLKTLVADLFTKIPNLRVGVIIHNDYCDPDTIQHLDLSPNQDEIIKFINRGSSCGGGDAPECYELALNYIHSKFSWLSPDRVAILIGDEVPHHVGYKFGTKSNELSWVDETNKCLKAGIKVYTIQALGRPHATAFYEKVAAVTGAAKLNLTQFGHIGSYITAVTAQQQGQLDAYQASAPEFTANWALRSMFDTLRGKVGTLEAEKVVLMSRFQKLKVPDVTRIDKFVEAQGICYTRGRGFYQLVKPETVQGKKEIIMVNRITGDTVVNQTDARKLLGLTPGVDAKVNPKKISACKEYDVFVQSTSYTRKLDADTSFLYEVK